MSSGLTSFVIYLLHFGFVNSFAKDGIRLFSQSDQPYRIKEGTYRSRQAGLCTRILINLIEDTFQPGQAIAVIAPNSILQITEVSPDFDMQMVGMPTQNFLPIAGKDDFFTHLLTVIRKTSYCLLTST